MRGIASDKSPCRVLTQNDRTAPAAKYRPESVVLSPPTRSSLTATVCSAVSQSHGSPLAEHIPCPNCVILNAVQCISGIAAINPATTLVFPIFRVCPPTTTIAITHHTIPRHTPQSPVLQPRQIPQILLQRPRRPTPEHLSSPSHLLAAQHPGPAPEDHAPAHRCVLPHPYPPPQNRPILHHARSRDPRLRRNNHVLPNHAVMPDVHQIIDLRPTPDPRLP